MNGLWIGVALSIITGAVVNEFCDVSPWLARRVMRRAALMWAATDSALADGYVVEWASVLEDCPGKITKLMLAVRFFIGAAGRTSYARVQRLGGGLPITRSWWTNERFLVHLSALIVFTSTVASTCLPLFGGVPTIIITGLGAAAVTATASIITIRSAARRSKQLRARVGDQPSGSLQ